MADNNLTKKLSAFPKLTALAATAEGAVQLKWTKVPLAEKYDIKRCTSPDGEFTHIEWATELSFTDTAVQKDTTYWYKVIAWKRLEGKKTSTKASAVKPVTVSDIPAVKNLRAEEKDGKIRLSWEKGEGNKFFIYRRSDYFSRMMLIGKTEKSSFCDASPVSGQAYHYTVQTVKTTDGKELHGNFSTEADCVFMDSTEIRSIRKVIGKKVLINVRVIAGADGYIFERRDKKDGEFTEVGRTEDITAVNFEDRLPARLSGYSYRVCAYKKIGDKEFKGGYSEVKYIKL